MTYQEFLRRQRRQRCITTITVLLIAGIILTVFGCSQAQQSKGRMVTETYVVENQKENLWTIAEKFIAKNTYGPRGMDEFTHGIYENNYDAVFADREKKGVTPGKVFPKDHLQINYWVADK